MARPSLGRTRMARYDTSGLTACYHVIAMLETQLRSAQDLRQRLEATVTSPEHHAYVVRGLCGRLLDEAVATAQAVAALRDHVCAKRPNSAAFASARKPDRPM